MKRAASESVIIILHSSAAVARLYFQNGKDENTVNEQHDFEWIKQSYSHITFNTHLANSK